MSFNTLDFMLLFAGTIILYYIVPLKWRNAILFIASYIFYAAYNVGLTLYLVAVTLFSYLIARDIERCREKNGGKTAKRLFIFGILADVGVLAFYKYFNFIASNISAFAHVEIQQHDWLVPLGISFITFTTLSYMIDVYKEKYSAEKNLFKYALYVAFFPKVVQGPIARPDDILPQFEEEHHFDLQNWREGMMMVLYGLFMKMVVADTAGFAVDTIYGSLNDYSGAAVLTATLLFMVQLYCDFAGYSYTAIGAARVFGFDVMRNFRQPYLSLSVAEFWRRWHMSLYAFLVSYIYIPLGGSRCSKARKHFNTMVVFGTSGLWHGAAWGYVIWGLLNGVYIIIEATLKNAIRKAREAQGKPPLDESPSVVVRGLHKAVQWVVTVALLTFAWIFFRAASLGVAVKAIRRIFTDFNLSGFLNYVTTQLDGEPGTMLFGLDVTWGIPVLLIGIAIVILIDFLGDRFNLPKAIADGPRAIRWTLAMLMIFAIMIFGVYGYGYSAGAFIYAGF